MDLQPTISKLYPENSIGPGQGAYAGQCISFAHAIIDFPPIGDTLAQKQAAVANFGIKAEFLHGNFMVGDLVITSESNTNGHGGTINYQDFQNLRLSECNFKLDKKVHHTRLLAKNSPKIIGVIRGPFKIAIPPLLLPIQPKFKIIFNNQQPWPSFLGLMAHLQDYCFVQSKGMVQLIMDYQQANLAGWGYETWPGGQELQIMAKGFMQGKILPLAPMSDIVLFLVKPSDWAAPHNPASETKGYCWAENGRIGAYIVVSENEMSQTYAAFNAFFDYARHEILGHGFYALAGKDSMPYGTDLCHAHYYGQFGLRKNFDDVWGDFDLNKLGFIINQ